MSKSYSTIWLVCLSVALSAVFGQSFAAPAETLNSHALVCAINRTNSCCAVKLAACACPHSKSASDLHSCTLRRMACISTGCPCKMAPGHNQAQRAGIAVNYRIYIANTVGPPQSAVGVPDLQIATIYRIPVTITLLSFSTSPRAPPFQG